ncbi:MAG: hypothetical protein JSS12_08310 [Verrucomicrobia bacterium]|nr:hypothetical protein [Verrucomicrobiota bacterium]
MTSGIGRVSGERVLYVGYSEEETSEDSTSQEQEAVVTQTLPEPPVTGSEEALRLDPDTLDQLLAKLGFNDDQEEPIVVDTVSRRSQLIRQDTSLYSVAEIDELASSLKDTSLAEAASGAVQKVRRVQIAPVISSIELSKKGTVSILQSEFSKLCNQLGCSEKVFERCSDQPKVMASASPFIRRSRSLSNADQARHECTLLQFMSLLRDKNAPESVLQTYLPALFLQAFECKSLDMAQELSVRGYNPLHAIAAQPGFSRFEKQLLRYRDESLFLALVSQKTEDEAESPLHAMCRFQNRTMLQFFLQSKNQDMRACLVLSCMQKTKTEGCNALLCLGHSLLDETISQVFCLQLFAHLIELYEERAMVALLRESKDAYGHTFSYYLEAAIRKRQDKGIEIKDLIDLRNKVIDLMISRVE